MALTCPDHELALAAVGDLAGDRIVEETVLQAIDDKPFEPVEGFADLPLLACWNGGVSCGSGIVQQSFHVLDGSGEGQGPYAGRVAIEGHHVGAPRGAIPEDEHLAPALVAKVHKLVAGAAQEAGEIRIARLERGMSLRLLSNCRSVDT